MKRISGEQLTLCYLITMSVVSSRVVVTIAVDDVGMEAVLIGNVLDGPDVATGLLQGVLAHNLVAITGLLLSV
jgi:hypothetical protein